MRMAGKKKPEPKKKEQQTAQEGKKEKQVESYEAKAMAQEVVRPKAERWAVVHVYSSKNDTIITADGPSGAET